MDNVKQVVIETAKQELQNLSENISADITTNFEASTEPSSKNSQYLSDITQNQKNLIILVLQKTYICRKEEKKKMLLTWLF